MKIRKLLKSMTIFVLAGVTVLSMAACGLTSIGGNASNDSGKITLVWYPNESASDYQSARDEFAKLITQATGKEVEQKRGRVAQQFIALWALRDILRQTKRAKM